MCAGRAQISRGLSARLSVQLRQLAHYRVVLSHVQHHLVQRYMTCTCTMTLWRLLDAHARLCAGWPDPDVHALVQAAIPGESEQAARLTRAFATLHECVFCLCMLQRCAALWQSCGLRHLAPARPCLPCQCSVRQGMREQDRALILHVSKALSIDMRAHTLQSAHALR